MRALIEKLAEAAPDKRGTVLVVGAGQGNDLATLRRLGAARLVLAEANPALSSTLAGRTDPARGEEVVAKAVVEVGESAVLRVVSQPHRSSLLVPSRLLEQFPGLRVDRELQVDAIVFAALVEGLELPPDSWHLLVIDAPGQASALLQSLPGPLLRRFAAVVVRAAIEHLYEGDSLLDETFPVLEQAGFATVQLGSDEIYPNQSVLMERDAARCEQIGLAGRLQESEHRIGELLVALEKQKADAARANEALESRLSELGAATRVADERKGQIDKLAQERDAHAKQADELKAQLEAKAAEHAAQAKLAEDRKALIEKLTQERDAHAKQAGEFKAQLEATAAECAAKTKLAADRHSLIQQINKERDEQTSLATSMQGSLDFERKQFTLEISAAGEREAELRKQIDALNTEAAQLKRDLVDSRQVVALSVRMQTMREADLKDLQARYQVVHQRSEEQHQLLAKLAERLQIASAYFHQLSALPEPAMSRPVLAKRMRGDPVGARPNEATSVPATASAARKPVAANNPAAERKKSVPSRSRKSRRSD